VIDIEGMSVEELENLNRLGLLRRDEIPEHNSWRNMKYRCYNTAYENWDCYGGRGIEIYEPWRNDFWCWFHYVGRRPKFSRLALVSEFSIDRIDNNRGYEPGNVRWTTQDVQNDNRRPFSYSGKGEENGRVLLTERQVIEIKKLISEGYSMAYIARLYKVSVSAISGIKYGRKWTHVQPTPEQLAAATPRRHLPYNRPQIRRL
jgi:hypothetical protein